MKCSFIAQQSDVRCSHHALDLIMLNIAYLIKTRLVHYHNLGVIYLHIVLFGLVDHPLKISFVLPLNFVMVLVLLKYSFIMKLNNLLYIDLLFISH